MLFYMKKKQLVYKIIEKNKENVQLTQYQNVLTSDKSVNL